MAILTGIEKILNTINTESFTLDSSGNLVFSPTTFKIVANTSDGSDSKAFYVCSGGDVGGSRGANLQLHGNEHGSFPGQIYLESGQVTNAFIQLLARGSNSKIELATNSTVRWTIDSSGHLVPSANTTYDIGTSASVRVRNIFSGGTVYMDNLGSAGGIVICATVASGAYRELRFGGSTNAFLTETSDGSDNAAIYISGGGNAGLSVPGISRGAFISVAGNEHGNTGKVQIFAGNVSGGDIECNSNSGKLTVATGGVGDRLVVYSDGKVGISKTTPIFWLDVVGGAGNDTARLAVSAAGSTTLRLDTFDDPSQTANNKNWAFRNRYNDYGLLELMRSTTSTGDALTQVMSWSKDSLTRVHSDLRIDSHQYYAATTTLIRAISSDGSDNQNLIICGGGTSSETRGSYIAVRGNESGSGGGNVEMISGNTSGATIYLQVMNSTGQIKFFTNSTERWFINSSGHLVPTTNNTYNIGDNTSPNKVNTIWVNNVRGVNNDMVFGPTSSHAIFFRTADTNRWSLGGSGHLIAESNKSYDLGSSSGRARDIFGHSLDLEFDSSSGNGVFVRHTHASFTPGNVFQARTVKAAATDFSFFIGTSSNGADTEVILRGDGNCFCDGAFTGGGADYAEYFETSDSEPIEIGKVVVLDGITGKVRDYDSQTDQTSDIFGIVRPKKGGASTVGNLPQKWHQKYLRDDFGAYILDQNQQRQINPEFDDEQEYVSRENRDEWVLVGLTGQIPVLASETKNPNWKKMKDISVNVELYLIK